jgi:hypothetical protein
MEAFSLDSKKLKKTIEKQLTMLTGKPAPVLFLTGAIT